LELVHGHDLAALQLHSGRRRKADVRLCTVRCRG
jgi:hypothetical protein